MAFWRTNKGRLSICFDYQGARAEEPLHLADTRDNRRAAKGRAEDISRKQALGVFDYAAEFPQSKRLARFGLRNGAMTLSDCARAWLDRIKPDVRPQSHYVYTGQIQHILKHPIADLPLDQVSKPTVEDFRRELKTRLGPPQINGILTRLSTIFDDAIDRNLAKTNRCAVRAEKLAGRQTRTR